MALKLAFSPAIIKSKEELLLALKSGELQTSKFNTLNEDQKLFIEMVVFGGYKPGQAMKVIKPHLGDPYSAGNRMSHNKDVIEAMEELTYRRDKMWMAQLTGSRDQALNVMEYIMKTTEDEGLRLVAAKEIVRASTDAIKSNKKDDNDKVSGINFNIKFAPKPTFPGEVIDADYVPDDEVVLVNNEEEGENPTGLSYKLNYSETIKETYKKED